MKTDLLNKISAAFDVVEQDGLFVIYVPFYFGDGDGFTIYLSVDHGWKITDRGDTLFHLGILGYDDDVDDEFIKKMLSGSGIADHDGVWEKATTDVNFASDLFDYIHVLSAINTYLWLKRHG